MVTASRISPDPRILAEWTLPRSAHNVPDARRRVGHLAETVLRDADRSFDVAVCASEILGNAVLLGGGDELHILVFADAAGLTVEITDVGSGAIAYEGRPADEGVRGLHLVAALADRWSSLRNEQTGHRSVCFDFDLSPAPQRASRP